MFERFTTAARACVVTAQEEARAAGARSVDVRALAIPLLAPGSPGAAALDAAGGNPAQIVATLRDDLRTGGLDKDALASLGIDLDAVAERTDAVFGIDALLRGRHRKRGHLPFERDAKKALELALREAIRLDERRIEERHLLLGILRGDAPAVAALTSAVDVAAVRRALEPARRRSA